MIARLSAALACAALAAAGIVAGAPAAIAAESIQVTSIVPSSPHVDDKVVLTATVTGATTPPASLTVTRTDRGGTQSVFNLTPTGTAGEYSGQDKLPAVWGKTTFLVQDSTFSQTQVTVYVSRLATALSITSSRKIVRNGRTVRVTAHLGSPTTNRTLTIYAQPYLRDRKAIASGMVDATSSNLSTTYRMYRRTRFIVRFGGDAKYRPASRYVVVLARAVIREHLRGYFTTSGAYRIYHAGDSPELDARMFPNQYHVCLYFRAQYYSGGAWHNASLSPCVRTDAEGRAAALLNNALALPYRLRAEWRGNITAVAAHGPWLRLRFR